MPRGLFDTSDLEAGIKKLDVRNRIFQLQPNKTPFITILSKMNKLRAIATEFSWFEDDLLGNYTQLNMAGHAAAGLTVLILDDASIFQVGDIAMDESTGETMLVTAVDDNLNTINVQRSFGTTAAAQIDDNDYIYKLGSAQQEGYDAPDALVTAKSKKYNYVQIFSKTVMITETAENVDTYGGNRRSFERNKKAIELKREIESQFLWGEKAEDTGGSHPRRSTGGVYEFIATNAPTLDMSSAALTESAFEGWLKDVFLYSSDDRYLFCGPLVASQISQWALGKQRLDSGVTVKYGVKVRTYHSTMGDLHVVVDRHFIGPHAGKGLALDVKQMTYRFLQNSDFKLAMNIQPKNSHYKQDEYSATIGLEIHLDKLHGILKGVA